MEEKGLARFGRRTEGTTRDGRRPGMGADSEPPHGDSLIWTGQGSAAGGGEAGAERGNGGKPNKAQGRSTSEPKM